MKATEPINFEKSISQLRASFDNLQAERATFLSSIPAEARCEVHPQMSRSRDDQKSWQARKPIFAKCATCDTEQQHQAEIERLQAMGVPLNLCHATFDNWSPADEGNEGNLEKVREFARARRGFLSLLGDLGTGKSHLAVAALRTFKRGRFIKQSELLRRLRQTYRDKATHDPVDEAQNAECLVLDEMGLSPGGRDELPLLHDVLDYRHGNMKPTILTGNITFDEMRVVIGPRMADRIRESAFAILNFGGMSRRVEARNHYFQGRQEGKV